MSQWTHSVCDPCWGQRIVAQGEPDRTPVRVRYEEGDGPDLCCYCGREHTSGIFVRDRPGTPQFCQHERDS